MGDNTINEPENSTVNDWMGQEVNRDQELADQAMQEAGGDEAKAEQIFGERSAKNDAEPVEELSTEERQQRL
jgi:hypothetical protein